MQDETDFDAMFPTSHFEQLLEDGFDFDSYAVTADLLVTKARKGWLSVGDFSSLVFCEYKTLYAHTLQAKQPTTPAMQNGTRIHALLEDEVMPQTVEIAPVSAEDRWALRFCNMIVAANVFIDTGVAREIPIIGRVGPFLVYGVVDQIERRTAAPHHSTPTTSSSCVIRDTKTRVSRSIPSSRVIQHQNRLQISLYARLMNQLSCGLSDSADNQTSMDKFFFQSIPSLDARKCLSPDVLAHIQSLLDEKSCSSMDGSKSSANAVACLESLLSITLSWFQMLPPVSSVMEIEYLWQRDHTVVLGVVQEVYDAHWVETVLKRGVEFWQGNLKVKEMLGLDSFTCTEAKDCAKNVVGINLQDACGESDCQVKEATVYDMESLRQRGLFSLAPPKLPNKQSRNPMAKKPATAAAATASKAKKAAAVPSRPPYREMIIQSIVNLKERNGSSRQAIKKYIGSNYKDLPSNYDTVFNQAVKKGVEAGVFTQPKGSSGPIKLVKKENTPAAAAAASANVSGSKKTEVVPATGSKSRPASGKKVEPAPAKKESATKKTAVVKSKTAVKSKAKVIKPAAKVTAPSKAKATAKKAAAKPEVKKAAAKRAPVGAKKSIAKRTVSSAKAVAPKKAAVMKKKGALKKVAVAAKVEPPKKRGSPKKRV
ncbi:exonuclease V [Chytriomyces cf. hyalinus JEL632]|nr:exonuclease V [Chytriomyces cf. hyalinus JEL632]